MKRKLIEVSLKLQWTIIYKHNTTNRCLLLELIEPISQIHNESIKTYCPNMSKNFNNYLN